MYVRTSSRRGFGQVVPAWRWGLGQQQQQPSLASQAASFSSAISTLVGVGIAIANLFKGCGQSCIQATSIVTQAQAILAQMLASYVSMPIRYASVQAQALQTFDTTWANVLNSCGNPQLGAAGQRCITDRQRGACTWKASPGGWNADGTYTNWGPSGSGTACWNWFNGIRDMIANDPFVQPDPPSTNAASGSTAGSFQIPSIPATVGGISTPLLIGGAVVLYLVGREL